MNQFITDAFGLIGQFFVFIVAAAAGAAELYRRKRRGIKIANTSVLLSYYTHGIQLTRASSGEVAGLKYSCIVTTDLSLVLYRIELPFATKVHLVGIPKRAGVVQLNPASRTSIMERVDLEGDYGNYFSLYASKGQQTQSRYILDPTAMAFTVDFCRSHNWEIIGNELYFLQASSNSEYDATSMFDDIAHFVNEIRPAIERPLSDKELLELSPYGEDRRVSLQCPLCSQQLVNVGKYFECTQGHGILLTGKRLVQLKNDRLRISASAAPAKTPGRRSLTCPSCSKEMAIVQYNGGKIQIDSCTHCPYRWLDAAEIAHI
jgi:hypothetical protein